jgi:hypothetical protein
MNNLPQVPAWLLEDMFLADGTFTDEGRTAVTGRPNTHLRAVLDVGNGAPQVTTVRLNEEQKRRLEGAKSAK